MSVGFLELLSQGSLSLHTSPLLLQLSLDFPQTLLQALELVQDQITYATVTTGLLRTIHLNTNTNINIVNLSQIFTNLSTHLLLPIYSSIHPSTRLSVYPSTHLCISLPTYLPTHPLSALTIYHLPTYHPPAYQSIYQPPIYLLGVSK